MTSKTSGHKTANIAVPERMAHLPKDHRGYPVPYNVWRDMQGTPHFTINDHEKVAGIIKHALCPICGFKLEATMWFVGGPLSALHPQGAYIDQPMHEECAKYALRVCPYLAAPVYSKRLDARKVDPRNTQDAVIFQDPTMIPERPHLFVVIEVYGYDVSLGGPALFHLHPRRPYVSMEFWRNGELLSEREVQEFLTAVASI